MDVAGGLWEDSHGAKGCSHEQKREPPDVAKGFASKGPSKADRENADEDSAQDEARVEQAGGGSSSPKVAEGIPSPAEPG